jgi:hypothetical protein
VPVNKLWVEAKADSIYEDLSTDNGNAKPFNASSSWFYNFTKRYYFHNIKMSGDTAPADTLAAEVLVKELLHIIEKGSYSPEHIFSNNETAVFFFFFGKGCHLGLASLKRKNLYPDLRL